MHIPPGSWSPSSWTTGRTRDPKRRRRDRFVEQALFQAGIRLIRFRARPKYCKHEIRNQLDAVLATSMAVQD